MDRVDERPAWTRLRPILAAAAAGAVVVSAIWAWTWQVRERRDEADYSLLSSQVESLNARLQQHSASLRELLDEYRRSQDVRVNLESQLALTEAQLKRARDELQSIADGNWEGRLQDERRRGEILDAQVVDLQQHLDDASRANAELLGQIEASSDIVRKLKTQVDNSAVEIDKLKRQLAFFTSQRPAPAAAGETGYRASRLESLNSLMGGRSSRDRRGILASVIPTIPQGLSASEFTALVAGMDSVDVLELLKSSRQHLRRPMEDQERLDLLGLLSDADASVAAELLSGDD